MIQLSLILCTFTDMRCQFKLQVFGMFMHNIISAKCIYNISFVILPYNNHFFIFNFKESRSALAAAFAAFRSAFSCIFSGLRPKSEKWT